MILEVPRSEALQVRKPGWALVYGRRKTGKTFMIRRQVPHDAYYFIGRGGYAIGEENLSYRVFRERFLSHLKSGETVVVDEFQRLPQEFLDLLHKESASRGKVILVGSSMSVVNRIVGKRGPLLGLVRPVKVGLVRPSDLAKVMRTNMLEYAAFLRDPWILRFVEEPLSLDQVIESIRVNVPALIGEVFEEEDRVLTERYELILRALSLGNSTPGSVASFISGLTEENLKGQDVKSYLENMVKMGLVEKVRVFKKRKHHYRIESPLIDLFYYLDTKTGFNELDVPMDELVRLAKLKVGLYFEDFVVKLLAEIRGAIVYKSWDPEIDGLLVKDGEVTAVEVKMGSISRGEVVKLREKGKFKWVVVARDGPHDLEIITHDELLRLAVSGRRG